jgi:hypothetical protein
MIVVQVKASGHVIGRKIAVIKDERLKFLHGTFFIYGMSQDFHAVTGGKVDRFLNLRDIHDFYERIYTIPTGQGKTLPDFQRGSFMIHTDENEIHSVK